MGLGMQPLYLQILLSQTVWLLIHSPFVFVCVCTSACSQASASYLIQSSESAKMLTETQLYYGALTQQGAISSSSKLTDAQWGPQKLHCDYLDSRNIYHSRFSRSPMISTFMIASSCVCNMPAVYQIIGCWWSHHSQRVRRCHCLRKLSLGNYSAVSSNFQWHNSRIN